MQRRLGDLEARARKVLSALGFTDQTMQKRFNELSGGWQMRCMLASTLLQDADIMILDEPTNFLDLLGIIWLQKYLVDLQTESSKTVIVVSHDRDFIDHVCQEIIMIKDQSLVYFEGNLTAYEEDLQAKRVNLTRLKEAQDKQIAHVEKTIINNIRAGKKNGDENKLRQAVSRQKKLEDRMGMQTNAKGGRFKLSRDMAGMIFFLLFSLTHAFSFNWATKDNTCNRISQFEARGNRDSSRGECCEHYNPRRARPPVPWSSRIVRSHLVLIHP